MTVITAKKVFNKKLHQNKVVEKNNFCLLLPAWLPKIRYHNI